jgi:pimeloyl-ACP methyl ester carboxylesterase
MDRFETSDLVRISYDVRGHGKPVIVCHGGPSTTHNYLVDDLGPLEGQATLIFHDYRGSGLSDAAPSATYTFERLADDLDELRVHLGLGEVSVLAHSMGGFVALEYALRHPDQCERLILMSCSPAGTPQRTVWPTLRALGVPRGAKLCGRALGYAVWWSWRPSSEQKTRARFSIMKVLQEGQAAFRDDVASREVLVDNDNAPTLERLGFRADLTAQLGKISCPVLIIFGDHDAPFTAGARLLSAGLPNARTLRFRGVGHHPLVEEHDRTIDAIAETLK